MEFDVCRSWTCRAPLVDAFSTPNIWRTSTTCDLNHRQLVDVNIWIVVEKMSPNDLNFFWHLCLLLMDRPDQMAISAGVPSLSYVCKPLLELFTAC